MDKYEYNVKSDQIKKLYSRKDFETAAQIADEIDWYKVKDNAMINRVADIYENTKQYEKAKEILLIAYERSPLGRQLAYKLTILALRTKNFVEADEFYQDFVEMSPSDVSQYLLKYRIAKAKGEDIDVLIQILEAYVDVEMDERWQYELAKLYHEAGNDDKCVAMCDELILWFHDGKYVEKAKELKKLITGVLEEYNKRYAPKKHAYVGDIIPGDSDEEEYSSISSAAETQVSDSESDGHRLNNAGTAQNHGLSRNAAGYKNSDSFVNAEPDLEENTYDDEEFEETDLHIGNKKENSISDSRQSEIMAETPSEEERKALEVLKAVEEAAIEAQRAADMARQLVEEAKLKVTVIREEAKYGRQGVKRNHYSSNIGGSQKDRFAGMSVEEIRRQLDKEELLYGDSGSQGHDSTIEIYEFDKNKEGKVKNIGDELTKTAEIDIDEIKIKLSNQDDIYNTANIQAALAKSMEKLLEFSEDKKHSEVRNAFTDVSEEHDTEEIGHELEIEEEIQPIPVKEEVKPLQTEEEQLEIVSVYREEETSSVDLPTEKFVQPVKESVKEEPVEPVEELIRSQEAWTEPEKPEEPVEEPIWREPETEPAKSEKPVEESVWTEPVWREPVKPEKPVEEPVEEPVWREPETEPTKPEKPVEESVWTEPVWREPETEPVKPVEESVEEPKAKQDETEWSQLVEESVKVSEASQTETSINSQQSYQESISKEQAIYNERIQQKSEGYVDDFSNGATKRIDRDEINRLLQEQRSIYQSVSGSSLSREDVHTGLTDKEPKEEQIEGQMTLEEVMADLDKKVADEEKNRLEALESEEKELANIETEDDMEEIEEGRESSEENGIWKVETPEESNRWKTETEEMPEEENEASDIVETDKNQIPEEYRAIFNDFVGTGSMEKDIAQTLDNLINNFVMDGTSRTNNVIVTGSAKIGKTTLGLSIIKAANKGRNRSGRRVAKVKASVLNKRGVALAMTQILGTDLIIEQAGNMMPNTLVDLMIAMKNYTEEMLIVLEDDKAAIDRMLSNTPDMKEFFTNRLDICEMEINDMVKIAKEYATDQLYEIDEMGELALYAKLDDISGRNPVLSIEDIQEVIDEAIAHANRFGIGKIFGKIRKGKGEMGVLTEHDFL